MWKDLFSYKNKIRNAKRKGSFCVFCLDFPLVKSWVLLLSESELCLTLIGGDQRGLRSPIRRITVTRADAVSQETDGMPPRLVSAVSLCLSLWRLVGWQLNFSSWRENERVCEAFSDINAWPVKFLFQLASEWKCPLLNNHSFNHSALKNTERSLSACEDGVPAPFFMPVSVCISQLTACGVNIRKVEMKSMFFVLLWNENTFPAETRRWGWAAAGCSAGSRMIWEESREQRLSWQLVAAGYFLQKETQTIFLLMA